MRESWGGYAQPIKQGGDFFNPISFSQLDAKTVGIDLYGESVRENEDAWTFLLQAGNPALEKKKVSEKSLSTSGVLVVDYSAGSQIYGEYKSRIERTFDYMVMAAANFACCPHSGPNGYAGPMTAMMRSQEDESRKVEEAKKASETERKCRACKGKISVAQRICAPGDEKYYCTLCAKEI